MSFLSSLLKIGGIAAAPFSGGASLGLTAGGSLLDKFGGAAGAVGDVLGGQQLNSMRDGNAIDLYSTQQGAQNQAGQLDLQRKGFESSNRSASARQALIGALLGGGVSPTSFSGGKASGGLFQALQGNPDALAAMKTMGGQGATAQATPLQFQGGQMVQAPTLSAPEQIDTGNSFLSILGRIGQIAGAAMPHLQKGEES
jgi:hypothetical protein